MKRIECVIQIFLVTICVANVICGPVSMSTSSLDEHLLKPRIRRDEQQLQQITDIQKPIDQEPITLKPEVQESPKKQQSEQIIQQQIKDEQTDKPVDQPIRNEYTDERINGEDCSQDTSSNSSPCTKHKPDYSKAIAIAAKGNAVAAVATAGLAAPVVLKSAKIAALAGLIPIKLAAKGAIIGTLIAKPIIIKSALVGATAVKLSHLIVGKPISIGSNLLAGAEALRAKLKARRLNQKGCNDVSGSACEKEATVAVAA